MDHKKYPAHKSDPFYNFSGSVALYMFLIQQSKRLIRIIHLAIGLHWLHA